MPASRIASRVVLGFEERVEQLIYLQQRRARDAEAVAVLDEEAFTAQGGERRGELFTRIAAKFLREGRRAHAAELELQDELADVALVGAGRQRAMHWEFARIHRSTIVNLDRVKELRPWFHGEYVVVLQEGTELTLSRSYRDTSSKRTDFPP